MFKSILEKKSYYGKITWRDWICGPFQILGAHFFWAFGLLKHQLRAVMLSVIGCLLLCFSFVAVFMFLHQGDDVKALKCGAIEVWCEIRGELLILLVAYFIVQAIRHYTSLYEGYIPWAKATLDRQSPIEFPCLILGRGGSGKTTLAGVLGYEYDRRQWPRASGFIDAGDGGNVVSSTPKEIGDAIERYAVSWRPQEIKIGYHATAIDMPGQLLYDWHDKIAEVAAIKDCKRVCIINVLTYGYNAEIRKYSEKENLRLDIDELDNRTFDVRKFNDSNTEHSESDSLHQRYFKHIFIKEKEGFKHIVDAITDEWDGKRGPKLVLLNLVTMAKHWEDRQFPSENCQHQHDLKSNWGVEEAAKFYSECLFKDDIDQLKQHYGAGDAAKADGLTIQFLPASLQWGDMRHEWFEESALNTKTTIKRREKGKEQKRELDVTKSREKLLIFEAIQRVTSDHDIDYEEKKKYEVMTRAHLADLSMHSIRIIQREIYRKPNGNWLDMTTRFIRRFIFLKRNKEWADEIKRIDGAPVNWSLTPPKDSRAR